MMFPYNGPHRRRYADPRIRPSNQRGGDALAECTRRQVEQLGRFIDELGAIGDGEVVAEAWQVLHPRAGGRRMRTGEPGE